MVGYNNVSRPYMAIKSEKNIIIHVGIIIIR